VLLALAAPEPRGAEGISRGASRPGNRTSDDRQKGLTPRKQFSIKPRRKNRPRKGAVKLEPLGQGTVWMAAVGKGVVPGHVCWPGGGLQKGSEKLEGRDGGMV